MDHDLTLRPIDGVAITSEYGITDAKESDDDRSDMSIASVDLSEKVMSLSTEKHIN